MTAPTKPRAAKVAIPVAVPPSAFELTAEEKAWAIRFFMATRQLDAEYRRVMVDCYVDTAELAASKVQRKNAPNLRLIAGGAK